MEDEEDEAAEAAPPMDDDWVPPHQPSYLEFVAQDVLGIPCVVLLLLAVLVSAVLTLILVRRGKGIMAGVALVAIVPLPFFLTVCRAINIGMDACRTIGMHPRPPDIIREVAYSTGIALFALWAGVLLTIPSYVIVVIGALRRAFRQDAAAKQRSESTNGGATTEA